MRQYYRSRQDVLALIADLGEHLMRTTKNGGNIDWAAESDLLEQLIRYEKLIHERMEREENAS
jgi:hypothetical protein